MTPDQLNEHIIKYGKNYKYYMLQKFKTYDEDVVQDAYIKMYLNLDKFDPDKGSIHTYLMKIITNEFLSKYRKESMFKRSDNEYEFIDEIEEDDTNRLINMFIAIDMLSDEKDKKIIKDFYFRNKSIKDISNELNMNMNTVKTSMRKSRLLLKRYISRMEKSDFF